MPHSPNAHLAPLLFLLIVLCLYHTHDFSMILCVHLAGCIAGHTIILESTQHQNAHIHTYIHALSCMFSFLFWFLLFRPTFFSSLPLPLMSPGRRFFSSFRDPPAAKALPSFVAHPGQIGCTGSGYTPFPPVVERAHHLACPPPPQRASRPYRGKRRRRIS